jgi:hypothetical protein
MAALTTDYTLADSAWTAVSAAKGTVIIYNPSTIPLFWGVAAAPSDLASVVGHELPSRCTIKLVSLGSNNVYIRSGNTGGGGKAAVSAY